MRNIKAWFRYLFASVWLACLGQGMVMAQSSGQSGDSDDGSSGQHEAAPPPPLVPVMTVQFEPNHPSAIIGRYGTRAFIPANSFVFPNGAEVYGPITLEMREVASKSGMILESLPTISNGRLLESGGVVKLTATAEGKEVVIAAGKCIYVQFPGSEMEGMRLFTGGNAATGVTNWTLLGGDKPSKLQVQGAMGVSPLIQAMAAFEKHGLANPQTLAMSDGKATVLDLLQQGLASCYTCRGEDAIKLEIGFDSLGRTIHAQTHSGTNSCYQKALLELARFIRWDPSIPSSQSNKVGARTIFVDLSPDLPVRGEAGENVFKSIAEQPNVQLWDDDIAFIEDLPEDVKAFIKSTVNELVVDNFAEEAFSVTKLGWINCDRFLGEKEVIAFNVSSSYEGKACSGRCFLAFKDINSVMEGIWSPKGTWDFKGVPPGRNATLVVLGKDSQNKPTVGVMEIITKKGNAGEVSVKSASVMQVEALLKSI